VEQRGGLQRRLARAHDYDVLSAEYAEVRMRGAVGAQFGREGGQRRRHVREVLDAGRDDHRAGGDPLAVRERQLEPLALVGDGVDQDLLDRQAEVGGEPLTVADERVQRDGQAVTGVGATGRCAERLEGVGTGRIREVRGEPLRLEEHPARHRRFP
jgi:hypothetical protein